MLTGRKKTKMILKLHGWVSSLVQGRPALPQIQQRNPGCIATDAADRLLSGQQCLQNFP
jgi:hypothetical protein